MNEDEKPEVEEGTDAGEGEGTGDGEGSDGTAESGE